MQIEENQNLLLKYSTYVVFVEELGDILENLICVEFVLEKKRMLENYHELENQVGKKLNLIY